MNRKELSTSGVNKRGSLPTRKDCIQQYFLFFFLLCSFLIFIACELGGPLPLPSYTIVYNANEGDGKMGRSTLVYGTARNLNANRFTRYGYRFLGWAETPTGAVKYANGQSVESLSKKDGDVITLYAVWAANFYTVVYDKNGGTGNMANSDFTYGEAQTLPPNTFNRAGYVFTGWSRTENGQVEFADGASVTSLSAAGTITLYARWGVTVAYNANGGTGDGMASSIFTLGVAQTLRPNAFTRVEYVFAGWAKTQGGNVEYTDGASVTITPASTTGGTITLYAQWTPLYEVVFNADDGLPAPIQQIVVSGGKVTEPAAMTKVGHLLDGWYRESTFAHMWNFASDTVTGPITLYAKWIPAGTVTFYANGGNPAPAPQTIALGSRVTEPAAMTKVDYTFEGWYKESTFNTKWDFADKVTGDVALHAKWEEFISMVFVPGGSFQMGTASGGDSDERPVHTVTLTGFYMGKYEVTQGQYQAVIGTNPSRNYGIGDNYPVYYVSWYNALVFCNKLSITQGLTPAYRINNSTDPAQWGSVPTSSSSNTLLATWNAVTIVSGSTGYRLPTEAQWEYAAKGGNGSPGNYTYAGSNTLGDVAWYFNNSGDTNHAVGTKAPNGLGLYDMSGNVNEWCWDRYGDYTSTAKTDPTGASSGSYRVGRGGNHSSIGNARSAYRDYGDPWARYEFVGFRIVRPAQ